MAEVLVPDIGDFTDVPVIEILVAVGDRVAEEQGLVTLESDKATMDVPSPEAGVVEEILVSVGDEVSEGTPIVRLGADGSTEAGEQPRRQPEAAAAAAVAPAASAAGESAPGPAAPPERGPATEGPIYASPAVRRIARERGVDLRRVEGSGRKGRITIGDVEGVTAERVEEAVERRQERVEEAVERRPEPVETGAVIEGLELAPWPEVDHAKHGPVERVELSRIKRISGPNLARNWVFIPHVTHHDEADITRLEAFRKEINAEQDVKVTMVALLLKACVPVLKLYPEFNSSLDGDGLILKRYYHLGFAADTPEGLLVPVIRDVDRKGLLEIAAELIELSAKAREGALSPTEMAGATFTISSLGGIGGTGFTPIVNAPQVAILGVTRAQRKPVWNPEAEEFEPRLMVPLSLSYDHRVVDGAAAARFCVSLVEVLEDFRRTIL